MSSCEARGRSICRFLSSLLRLPAYILSLSFVITLSPTLHAKGHLALENRLAGATSPYLREAATQPVHWQPWDDKAFDLARELDRPILLDIGAVWCHWCHVMDKETYGNPEVADLINRHFVPIKVDRDERPDIDARYQMQVQAVSGQGGWPLTAFLVPTGKVFFGGGTFFPEPRYGRPGFKDVLGQIHSAYEKDRERVWEAAEGLYLAVATFDSDQVKAGEPETGLIRAVEAALLEDFDEEYGGFGNGAKFPQAGALELALNRYFQTGDPRLLQVVTKTLDAMANGGIHDQLGGGFHRYAVDREWRIPHFEKILTDQAQILRDYLEAYQATGNERYRDVAKGIIRYVRETLTDPATGGLYAHQDADSTRSDDGAYYTWTEREVRDALLPKQAEVLVRHFHIEAIGEVRGHPGQNVLRLAAPTTEIAAMVGMSSGAVQQLIAAGKRRLAVIRKQRKAPFVDRTLLSDRNGLMAAAYLQAYRVLGDADLLNFALKTLDFLLQKLYVSGSGMHHGYADGRITAKGLLADQVFVASALLDAFESSGALRYLEAAQDIMSYTLGAYGDGAGLFDAPQQTDNLGILGLRTRPFQDDAAPGANATAARVLSRLYQLTNKEPYRTAAGSILRAFAGSAAQKGRWSSSYALALDLYLNPPAQAITIGNRSSPDTLALWRAALSAYRPNKIIATYDPKEIDLGTLPPAVAAAARIGLDNPKAKTYVCVGLACSLPATDPQTVRQLVENFGKTMTEDRQTDDR